MSHVLSDEEKRSILNQRLAQFASESYQHELNKTVAENTNAEEAVTEAEKAIAVLDAAITVHESELAKLPVVEVIDALEQ